MSINRWLDKEDVVHIYNEKLLSCPQKKEWNNVICSNMDGLRDYHTKWSKSEREIQMPYDITYTWNRKYDTNELIYKTVTHRQRTSFWLIGDGGGGGLDWELGTNRCTCIYRTDRQGPTVEHRELYSISCAKPLWKTVWKRTYMYLFAV